MAQEAVATDPLVPQRGLSRVQHEALVATGAPDGERVELLEGVVVEVVLVEVVPQGEEHYDALLRLTRRLVPRLPEPWALAVHGPLAATDRSEPEPDLAVVQEAAAGLPRTAALAIEVAVGSHRADLVHEPRLYAAAAVEQCWVVDVPAREVVVHTGPRTEPGVAGYAVVRRLPWSEPLSVLGVPVDLAAPLTR